MKKAMMITGAVSVAAFVSGSLFKAMHWPGANLLLLLAITLLSFLFIPLMVLFKTRETESRREKIIISLGSVLGFLLCMAVLFNIMHWNGRTQIWITTTAFSMFVFIPVYFFTGLRNAETRLNTIVTTVLLVGATLLQFTMIRVYPPAPTEMYTYFKNEQLLKIMQQRQEHKQADRPENEKLAREINQTCEKIKSLILIQETGIPTLPENMSQAHIVINEGDLKAEFYTSGGDKLLNDLKTSIQKFNETQASASGKIPVDHSILDPDFAETHHNTNLYVLNNITQLQMYLVNADQERLAEIN